MIFRQTPSSNRSPKTTIILFWCWQVHSCFKGFKNSLLPLFSPVEILHIYRSCRSFTNIWHNYAWNKWAQYNVFQYWPHKGDVKSAGPQSLEDTLRQTRTHSVVRNSQPKNQKNRIVCLQVAFKRHLPIFHIQGVQEKMCFFIKLWDPPLA